MLQAKGGQPWAFHPGVGGTFAVLRAGTGDNQHKVGTAVTVPVRKLLQVRQVDPSRCLPRSNPRLNLTRR